MANLEGFEFFPLHCNEDGALDHAAELHALTSAVAGRPASDVVFIAHGFRNDEADASGLYSEFLRNYRAHLDRSEFAGVKARTFIVGGIFWPSKTFRESFDEGGVQAFDDAEAEKTEVRRRLQQMKSEAPPAGRANIDKAIGLLERVEDDTAAQDEFVSHVLSLLDRTNLDATEGLEKIRSQPGSRVLEILQAPLFLPTVEQADDEGGVGVIADVASDTVDGRAQAGLTSVAGSIFGGIGQFLNLTTWYQMKDRAGKVGENGVADAVRAVRAAAPAAKIHLVGHSLGARVMAACTRALADEGVHKVDSLTLLQAAFSHYGLSSTRKNKPGFFRAVIDKRVVRGPLVSTYSAEDRVVGLAYAVASRVANDNTRAVGDENDEFGGLGRNGAQNAPQSVVERLHQAGTAYNFVAGKIINLNGSGGLITSHGDVRNPNVTYAFASAVAKT
jgi:hypothetical protein